MTIKNFENLAEILNSSLVSHRLCLEPISGQHAEFLFPLMQNVEIYKWISSLPPKSIEHLQTWWQARESRLSPDGKEAWLNWAVKRKIDGAYVGILDAEINRESIASNIGYIFFPEYWGHGLATEAVTTVVQHFSENNILKIFATVTAGNKASCRVLEKSEFVRTRVIPDNDTIRGAKYDDVEYVWAKT
jgi:ribosomal-protein-alanine N-acetyltransferase